LANALKTKNYIFPLVNFEHAKHNLKKNNELNTSYMVVLPSVKTRPKPVDEGKKIK
jgi:hypothetical protein